jgi:hypothetical protein
MSWPYRDPASPRIRVHGRDGRRAVRVAIGTGSALVPSAKPLYGTPSEAVRERRDPPFRECLGPQLVDTTDPEPSAELATVEEEIGARRATESELGEKLAIARLATEAAESEAVSYFRDSEKLTRRGALLAKIEGKPMGHTGLMAADFRVAIAAEIARRRLMPTGLVTDFERVMGLNRRAPTKPPTPAPVAVSETRTETTTRSRRAR